MTGNTEIPKKADEVLDSLEGLQKAEPGPFLYTRVMAKVNRAPRNVWEKTALMLSRPAMAVAAVIFFIIINSMVFLFKTDDPSASPAQDAVLITGNDFNLSVTSIYDLNPEQNDIVRK